MKDYPIGTHFIHDDKEYVVEKAPENCHQWCSTCCFNTELSICQKMECDQFEREDKINVIFTYLSTVKDLK